MTNRSGSDRAARAEARRRARLAARGELDDETSVEESASPAEPPRRGLLQLLFPSAPPLPGKPDPLAGFSYQGPLRPIVLAGWLLRRNLLAWVVPGILSGLALIFGGPTSGAGFIGTMLYFVILIAAGWIGWQRPALYGFTAALVGYLVFLATALALFSSLGFDSITDYGPLDVVLLSLATQGLMLLVIGFITGWYGGYLRRRQASVNQRVPRARR
jgi:hypothetical protein